jgi:L-aspartate oxidase
VTDVITLPRFVGRLLAPEPGWTVRADVVVVGSGIAGLSTVLHARRHGLRVLLVTKALLDAGSTRWAQGGIAAALGPDDSPEDHLQDTLTAGVGLCDEAAVRVLVTEGPQRVRELAALGARFDVGPQGFELGREGGHLYHRVVHAGGDATGMEIERALIAAVRADEGVEVIEHAAVIDLMTSADGHAAGVTLHVLGEGSRDGVGAALARAVVLATGGMGQIFASTTNPAVSTGDGVALALRAGATVTDLEFVQFHPTALYLGPASRGQQPLVSEAMRGEGALLIDAHGERVIGADVHPLRELAPRDVVAKAMSRVMAAQRVDHLYLDARHLGAEALERRFPTILASCRAAGVDPVVDPIPVAPAAHYASGGVRTDLAGRTSVPGLYACGEVACTGVHGANRLASNSLLEGVVFAARIGEALTDLPPQAQPVPLSEPAGLVDASVRSELALVMTESVGVLRSESSLEAAGKSLQSLSERTTDVPTPEAWEASGMVAVAAALVAAAAHREETRGCHWREDFPESDPTFLGHLVSQRKGDTLSTTYESLVGVS